MKQIGRIFVAKYKKKQKFHQKEAAVQNLMEIGGNLWCKHLGSICQARARLKTHFIKLLKQEEKTQTKIKLNFNFRLQWDLQKLAK